MAEKDAKVRLNLAASGFLTQLQGLRKASEEFEKAVAGIGDGGEKASRKIGAFSSAAKAGFGAAKSSLVELGHSLKSAIGMVATLGGALSLAGSVKGALELTKGYRDLANQITAGTGAVMSWQEVQKTIEGTAGRWKQSNADVSASYQKLWDDLGDSKVAAAGVESVAKAVTAGFGSFQSLTSVVGVLNEKFGIMPEQMDETLAHVISLGNKGSISIEEMGEKLGMLGASARAAGFEGQDAIKKIFGMIGGADTAGGNMKQKVKSVTSILDTLSDPEKLKAIKKEIHVDLISRKTGTARSGALEKLIADTGGKHEVLAKIFSGPELSLMTEFGKTFSVAFKNNTGDLKMKRQAGLDALNASFEAGAKANLEAADLEKMAAARKGDADRNLQDALNKITAAFSNKDMIEAIDAIAKDLPALAKAIASMLGFALEHPKLAITAAVGGKIASDALPAAGGALAMSVIKKLATRGAGSAATKLAAAEGTTAATTAAETVTPAAAAGGLLTAAAGLTVAAGVTALAMGGAVGYELAKPKSGLRKRDGTMQGVTDVSQPGTPEDYDRIMAEERRKQQKSAGISEVLNGFRYGGDAAQGVGGGGRNASAPHAKAELTVDAFVKSLKSGGDAGARTALSLTRAAEAADQLTASMARLGAPPGTNGLPPNPGDMSGSAPR